MLSLYYLLSNLWFLFLGQMVDNDFALSFKYRTLENLRATTYFAFTYPYSYKDLQVMLSNIDTRFSGSSTEPLAEDVYYHRECVCYTPQGLRVDLVTISSHHGISSDREPRLQNLFPDVDVVRPLSFPGKKVSQPWFTLWLLKHLHTRSQWTEQWDGYVPLWFCL